MAAALRAIADLRLRAGAFRDAEPLYRQALAIQVKKFAEGHFEIAKTRSGIAACLIELGQYAEAESMLLGSLADLRRGPGDEDAATQVTLRRIVELYGRWRKPEKADPYRTYLRD